MHVIEKFPRWATSFTALTVFGCYAYGQTNYDAQNFSTNSGYQRGFGIISTSQPVDVRWQGNDPYNTNTLLGETDLIARVAGYTPLPLANSSLIQGGLGVADGVLPGTNSVRIWKTFSPTSESSFFAEWSLIPSLEGAPYNLADTFSFDLRNSADTESLLKLQLTPGINVLPNAYTLQVIAAGAPTQTVIDLGYQGLFQVAVDLSGSGWDLSLVQVNSTNRSVIASYSNLASGSLASGTTSADFATISVDWDLASGNNLEPGSNYLIANQFSVVPEPSTWSLFVGTLFGLGLMYLRKRVF